LEIVPSPSEVLDAWLAPAYRYFKLQGADGDTYFIRHDERLDNWQLTSSARHATADKRMNTTSLPPSRAAAAEKLLASYRAGGLRRVSSANRF
jgi:hypothetical protein